MASDFVDIDLRFVERELLVVFEDEIKGIKRVRILQWRKQIRVQDSVIWLDWSDVPVDFTVKESSEVLDAGTPT